MRHTLVSSAIALSDSVIKHNTPLFSPECSSLNIYHREIRSNKSRTEKQNAFYPQYSFQTPEVSECNEASYQNCHACAHVVVPPTANRSFQCTVTPRVPDQARNCTEPTVNLGRVTDCSDRVCRGFPVWLQTPPVPGLRCRMWRASGQ